MCFAPIPVDTPDGDPQVIYARCPTCCNPPHLPEVVIGTEHRKQGLEILCADLGFTGRFKVQSE